MNRFILIVVKNNIKRFINKCNTYNINLYSVNYVDEDKIIVKIEKKDFDLVKKYNYYSDIEVYSRLGLDNIKEKLFREKYFIFIFIMCLVGMYLVSNVIFSVSVIHSNKKVREFVSDELKELGIREFSYKKDFHELDKIKKIILENNKDKLEWISITNVGMTYVVRVEERILDELSVEKGYCNILSIKEALVTNIYGTNGEIIVSVNDVVKPGDVLISGNILLNEENKGYVCASGKVLGKVWYRTSIKVDRDYLKKEYTGKKRYNFTVNNKVLRSNKYNMFDKKYLIKTKFFSLYKEIEYKEVEYKYNDKEVREKALVEVEKKFKDKLGEDGKILSKKILTEDINDRNINLSLFITTEEIISKQEELDIPNKLLEE